MTWLLGLLLFAAGLLCGVIGTLCWFAATSGPDYAGTALSEQEEALFADLLLRQRMVTEWERRLAPWS